MRLKRILVMFLLQNNAPLSLLLVVPVWLAVSILDELHSIVHDENVKREWINRHGTSIDVDELSLGKLDRPLVIGDGITLTGVEEDRLGKTLIVDVKARRNILSKGETCELMMTASCSRFLIPYDTRGCEGGEHDSDCTPWRRTTAKGVSLQKKQTTLVTGWCERSFIPLAGTLRTDWYRDGYSGVVTVRVTKMYSVIMFKSTYHSWLVNCK
jgi:hypothetical protein